MLSWDYFRNPITGIVKLGIDTVTGNIKTDGNQNTPADYVAPVVNDYVETKTQQLVPKPAQDFVQEKITEPAQEWAEQTVVEPVKNSVKVVTDVFNNGYQAATQLVSGSIDTVKKYAPLAAAGVVAVLLLKK